MASDQSFVDYVMDQLSDLEGLTHRKMFGEYSVYLNGKMIAMICDNRFLVKITEAGRKYITEPKEGIPYPGAKPCFHIDEALENPDWIIPLLQLTEAELPMPKPKKKKVKK